ncbi:hypothetical protein N7509_003883 [Penicillium cosmopolitanum]|uniref:Uncharacterized protein n=1 Tax=Penicillium cosmopolitanum TaxID=1131564 RepID=A0A9W9W5Y4_9EURO|nr:uncharacterized protein N7509_003883 [Penicillium cosmopolitanum]KAJ5404012.1 hypothetical protein N7509_003883 [Penicillium cosmopolitanum]
MPAVNASSLKSGENDTLPLANTGSLEGFIKYLGILASSPESQFAATVLGEITKQREQIQSQDEELKENKITINGMFKANQDEKLKQQDSASQIESLRATVHEKEIEVAEYSRKLESLQQEIVNLKASCSQEAAKASQSVKDITTLQNNLKEKDKTIDQMKTTGLKLKSTLSTEQKKSKELEAANASMRTELQAIRDRIQNMEDFTVQYPDIDDDFVTAEFKNLWTSATNELFPIIEQDVPENILKPSYFLSEGNNLRETLEDLAGSNGEKEAFFRRMLLSINPDAERNALNTEIRAVVQKMLSYAGGLFPESQLDLFCTKIKKIAQSAAEAWLPMQRSRQKFATDFEPFDPEYSEWDRFPFAGEDKKLVAPDLQGLYILNVFPCISWLEDDDYDPLTKVIQLRSSQTLYLAAQQEAAQIASCVPARRSSNRPRRQSTAGSNGNHFLGGSSAKV